MEMNSKKFIMLCFNCNLVIRYSSANLLCFLRSTTAPFLSDSSFSFALAHVTNHFFLMIAVNPVLLLLSFAMHSLP